MTSNNKPGKSSPARNTTSNRPTPPTRRSARQERLAARQDRRDLRTAGTYGRSGGMPPIVLWSGVAVVIAAIVIVAAVVLTKPPSTSSTTNFNAPTVTTPSDIPANGQTLGNASAPVTLDLYSDFRCTGCGAFVTNMEPKLVTDFVKTGKIKLVYHDFLTIDADGSNASRDAANAALCASDEGKFWQMHDWLFANQSPQESPSAFTIDRLIGIGKAAAVDSDAFETCVNKGTHDSEIAAEQTSAPAGINATPTIFINGKVVNSSLGGNYQPTYDDIAKAIRNATPAASTTAAPSAGASAS